MTPTSRRSNSYTKTYTGVPSLKWDQLTLDLHRIATIGMHGTLWTQLASCFQWKIVEEDDDLLRRHQCWRHYWRHRSIFQLFVASAAVMGSSFTQPMPLSKDEKSELQKETGCKYRYSSVSFKPQLGAAITKSKNGFRAALLLWLYKSHIAYLYLHGVLATLSDRTSCAIFTAC